jgi:hypothetical protein
MLIEPLNKLSILKKDNLKTLRIKVNDIINELGNNMELSIQTFKGLCYLLNINICITRNIVGEKINRDVNSDLYWVCDINKKTLYKKRHDGEYINNKYYLVKDINKPFNSETYYTAPQLREICDKTNIKITQDNGKNIIKKELYKNLLYKIEL